MTFSSFTAVSARNGHRTSAADESVCIQEATSPFWFDVAQTTRLRNSRKKHNSALCTFVSQPVELELLCWCCKREKSFGGAPGYNKNVTTHRQISTQHYALWLPIRLLFNVTQWILPVSDIGKKRTSSSLLLFPLHASFMSFILLLAALISCFCPSMWPTGDVWYLIKQSHNWSRQSSVQGCFKCVFLFDFFFTFKRLHRVKVAWFVQGRRGRCRIRR